MTKRLKWLLIQCNLAAGRLSRLEAEAREGWSEQATEYDKDYRVFAEQKVFLETEGERQRIRLCRLQDGTVVRSMQWESTDESVIRLAEYDEEGVLAEAVGEGGAFVRCRHQGKYYGIFLQVGSSRRDVNHMYRMATVPWRSEKNFYYRPTKGKIEKTGFEIYYFGEGEQYYGIPYTNRIREKTETTYKEFKEKRVSGHYWKPVFDGKKEVWNMNYPGNDCSTALWRAWNMQQNGSEEESFFADDDPAYPSTFTMLSLKNKSGGFAVCLLGAGTEESLNRIWREGKMRASHRENFKDGFDTKRAVRLLGEENVAYDLLKPGDAVLRFSRVGLLKAGHVMLVRYHDEKAKRVYFMDQHSVPKKNRPYKKGHLILPGQSTYSTWYSMTYSELYRNGYLPIRRNEENKK